MDTAMQFRHSCCFVFCCSQLFLLFKLQKKVKSVPTSAELLLLFFLGVFSGHENCNFGNAAENKLLNSELFSTQSSKLVEKNLLFQKKILSLRMIHVTHGMQYWRHVENFWWFQSFTCSNLEKEKKTVKGKKNKLSSKSSSGLVENSFDDPAHIFSANIAKVRSFVCQVPKSFKKGNKYFNNTKSPEWFIWTCKRILWQTFHSSSGNSELPHSKRKLFE